MYRIRFRSFLLLQPLKLAATLALERRLCTEACAAHPSEVRTGQGPARAPPRPAQPSPAQPSPATPRRTPASAAEPAPPPTHPPTHPHHTTPQAGAFVSLLEAARVVMGLPLALPQHLAANGRPATPVQACLKLQVCG